MVSKASRRIKLSVNLRPFVSRVVRDGKAQKLFAQNWGYPVGQCVAAGVRKGMSGAEIHQVARDCARGGRRKAKAKRSAGGEE
jgi:hypothetical protein